ncbi:MAG: hypothetical protein KAT43_05345 [Nanoarchaeota archaeon]|nr:hypothetical protein [Nanoarchaeota archaeon]
MGRAKHRKKERKFLSRLFSRGNPDQKDLEAVFDPGYMKNMVHGNPEHRSMAHDIVNTDPLWRKKSRLHTVGGLVRRGFLDTVPGLFSYFAGQARAEVEKRADEFPASAQENLEQALKNRVSHLRGEAKPKAKPVKPVKHGRSIKKKYTRKGRDHFRARHEDVDETNPRYRLVRRSELRSAVEGVERTANRLKWIPEQREGIDGVNKIPVKTFALDFEMNELPGRLHTMHENAEVADPVQVSLLKGTSRHVSLRNLAARAEREAYRAKAKAGDYQARFENAFVKYLGRSGSPAKVDLKTFADIAEKYQVRTDKVKFYVSDELLLRGKTADGKVDYDADSIGRYIAGARFKDAKLGRVDAVLTYQELYDTRNQARDYVFNKPRKALEAMTDADQKRFRQLCAGVEKNGKVRKLKTKDQKLEYLAKHFENKLLKGRLKQKIKAKLNTQYKAEIREAEKEAHTKIREAEKVAYRRDFQEKLQTKLGSLARNAEEFETLKNYVGSDYR